jgi:hypothetical protein
MAFREHVSQLRLEETTKLEIDQTARIVIGRVLALVRTVSVRDREVPGLGPMLAEGKLQLEARGVGDERIADRVGGGKVNIIAEGLADSNERVDPELTDMNVAFRSGKRRQEGHRTQQQDREITDKPGPILSVVSVHPKCQCITP